MDFRTELDRHHRVADQLITMYAVLRDRYARLATILTLAIFFSSVILIASTFPLEDILPSLGLSTPLTRLIPALFSAVILFASIAELSLKWRERAQRYGDAAERLSEFKAIARSISIMKPTPSETEYRELAAKYQTALQGIPRIPDRQFLRLKSYHLRKVRLSQLADDAPGCPIWMIRFRLWIHSLRICFLRIGKGP